MGDMDQALRNYEKSISINPKIAKPYYNRGLVHAKAGNVAQSVNDFLMAMKYPKGTETFNMGVVYGFRRKKEKSAE